MKIRNLKKIARIFIIIFIILIVGFFTLSCLTQVLNTNDPYFARKVALKTMMIIIATIMAGGFFLYSLREQKDL